MDFVTFLVWLVFLFLPLGVFAAVKKWWLKNMSWWWLLAVYVVWVIGIMFIFVNAISGAWH